MSINVMSKIWTKDLEGTDLLLMLALADHANDEGDSVHPGQLRLAWKSGTSERTVRRLIADFIRRGYLAEVGQKGERGPKIYRLELDAIPDKESFHDWKVKQFVDEPTGQIGQDEIADRPNGAKPTGQMALADRPPVVSRPANQRKYNNNRQEPSGNISSELFQSSLVPASEHPAEQLPLNNGTKHPVYVAQVAEFSRLYPAVNVPQELRNMVGWLMANPSKRKTRTGIVRFMNNWLARVQDRGPRNGNVQQQSDQGSSFKGAI